MHLETITCHTRLAELRPAWEAVYAADPEARFYVSWPWLSGWFRFIGQKGFVVAAKPDANSENYFGFLPLQKRARMSRSGRLYGEVAMGPSPMADYTGFICAPEMQTVVTMAFAKYLASQPWTVLRLDHLSMSEGRAKLLMARFPSKQFRRTERDLVNKIDNVDNSICPYIRLPDDWDDYLANSMGTNTRQKARRFLRKLDSGDELRVTHATPETFDRDFDIMIKFWIAKWAPRKGDATKSLARSFEAMLRHCLQAKRLFMPTLWRGETPLGALAILVDTDKRSLLFKVSGLDTSGNNPPPGFLLHAYSIRYAIRNGFKIYDLLQGNEPYKYSFGAEEHRIQSIYVHRRTPRVIEPGWQPRTEDGPRLGQLAGLDSSVGRSLPQSLSGFVPLEDRFPRQWKPSPNP